MHSPTDTKLLSPERNSYPSGIILRTLSWLLLTTSDGDHLQVLDDNGINHDFSSLSLYEQKCYLINREINAMGMGKYQWYIWSLCGLGYFLDLLWAQAFGLIATPLQQELGFSSA